MDREFFNRLCCNCGLTYGAHHAGTSPYPRNHCPGHEGRMDWYKGPGTVFENSGKYGEVPYNTPAKGVKE